MGILETLGEVCSEIGQDQYAPNQRWIRDMLRGMAVSGSPMLSEIGRALEEVDDSGQARRLIHTEKRLSHGLNSDRLDDSALLTRHLDRVAGWTRKNDGAGTVIAVDYTDLAKPYANTDHGMEGVSRCWNGSDHETGIGYPVVQIEADMGDVQVPVILHPFSYDEIAKSSQTNVFLEQMAKAAPYIGSRAWWTSDRGFDNTRYFAGMDALKLRWICRLQYAIKNQRDLFVADGRRLSVEDAALEVIPRFKMEIKAGKKRAKGSGKPTITLEVGSRKVFMSNQKVSPSATGPARTLIVVWGFGKQPLAFLVSEHLEGKAAILEAARAYGRRWKCEEKTRAMKDSRGWGVRLEDVRALTLRGIRRLALLAVILYAFLATVRDLGSETVAAIMALVSTFGKVPPDPLYRLFRGLGELLRRAWPRTPSDRDRWTPVPAAW